MHIAKPTRRIVACVFAVLAVSAVPGRAAEQKHLAVLEFELADGVKLDRVIFSDLARSAVNQRAPQLFVMTRESTEALLQANGKTLADCAGECEVDVGRKLGADYIISGRISNVGSFFFLSMRLFSTADGRLLASADARGKSADELVEKSDGALDKLLAPLAAIAGQVAGATRVETKSGLVFVYMPGGPFHSGCENQGRCHPVESDQGTRTVASFWIGKTDVTVLAYARCVTAQVCKNLVRDTPQHTCNLSNKRDNHPMNCVGWLQAEEFCEWSGGRLPTSEQWEYAAKSGERRIYPWGNDSPGAGRANFCDVNCPHALDDAKRKLYTEHHVPRLDLDDGYAATSPVGSFPAGATRWGLLDMAGNVLQWTLTDFDPADHNSKVVRGGAWAGDEEMLRSSMRMASRAIDQGEDSLGFRCVEEAQ